MINLIFCLIALYAIGFAAVTLWFIKMRDKSLEVSVRNGAVWWKFVAAKIKEKLNSQT